MRTTIAIDEELMDALMRAEEGVSRSEAVRRAIKEYLWQRRVDEFMKLAGSGIVDLDWREMERQEAEEVQQMEDLRKHHERKPEAAGRHIGVGRVLRRR